MKTTKCDVAYLDIQMREMNGVILARKLKEIYPKVNIVFVTGYSQYTNEAFHLHASGLVTVLERVGAEQILKRGINSYSVDVETFFCDLYDYEKDNATSDELNRFRGEYMKQYSWAEVTLARLYWEKENKAASGDFTDAE